MIKDSKKDLKKLKCKGIFCAGKCVKLCKDEGLMKSALKLRKKLKKKSLKVNINVE